MAYVITKIAVGIYAGGIVSATLLPEWNYQIGPFTLDSFWIGSVLVVLLTGLYTVLGGMRAVAYTEALQTIILIIGSVLVTYFGLQGGRRLGASSRKHRRLARCSTCGSRSCPTGGLHWAPIKESDASGEVVGQAWYFNGNYPVAGHAVLRADHRPVVLVHRSVHRAAGAGRPERNAGSPRLDLRRVLEAAAGVHLHHSRHHLLRAGQERQSTRALAAGRRRTARRSPRSRRPRFR